MRPRRSAWARPASSGSVAALATVLLTATLTAMTFAVTAQWWQRMRGGEASGFAGVGLLLGAVLAGGWSIRLGRWFLASRADGRRASVTANLGGYPYGGGAYQPKGSAVWLTLRLPAEPKQFQRVLWQPWMGAMDGSHQATVRRGPGPVSVVDVHGLGRLWPTSTILTHPPRAAALRAFRTLYGQPRYVLSGAFAFIVVPIFFGAMFAKLAGTAWGVPYIALVWLATLGWFGIAPPGWIPRKAPDAGHDGATEPQGTGP